MQRASSVTRYYCSGIRSRAVPRAAYAAVRQRGGGKEDVSVNELACYLEESLTLPRPMSYMASLMYN